MLRRFLYGSDSRLASSGLVEGSPGEIQKLFAARFDDMALCAPAYQFNQTYFPNIRNSRVGGGVLQDYKNPKNSKVGSQCHLWGSLPRQFYILDAEAALSVR